MKEIKFSRWLFELPAKQHSQFSPSGSTFLPFLGLPSKSHRENSISSIFSESPHHVDMKNVVKCQKHFLGYFNALKTHCVPLCNDQSFQKNRRMNMRAMVKDDSAWIIFKPEKFVSTLIQGLLKFQQSLTYLKAETIRRLYLSDAGIGGEGGQGYLAEQLTLFQPGRADYPHLLLLEPPMFFTFRHKQLHLT